MEFEALKDFELYSKVSEDIIVKYEGKKVEVDIQIIYNSDKSTKRPLGFFVEYKIDGIEQSPIYHYN